jgi:hypothetical protein
MTKGTGLKFSTKPSGLVKKSNVETMVKLPIKKREKTIPIYFGLDVVTERIV